MNNPDNDARIIRRLAGEYAEAAALPVHREKADLWRRLNRLEPVRPLVWINEIPWQEMNVDDELTLGCSDPWLRSVENNLRRTLYQWRHLPCDMVLDPVIAVDYLCSPTSSYADYGLEEQTLRPDGEGSAGFLPIIQSESDVDRLRTPEVTMDWEETERRYQLLSEICDGIIPVEKRGIRHQWCSPWDQMIRWYGIERLFTDMIERPQLVHRLLHRFMAAVHQVLDRQEAMGLLQAGNGNHRVGSGGLGITDELPPADFDPGHVQPKDQWGSATAQIFTGVSPAMHEEFSLQYERPYLERFGLTCYGCCEPLHNKIGILRSIKNLRRISMSCWIDVDKAVAEVRDDYIFSYKPIPAIFAGDRWDRDAGRAELAEVLQKAEGCRLELIMKDISTVAGEPRRLWQWAEMAMSLVED